MSRFKMHAVDNDFYLRFSVSSNILVLRSTFRYLLNQLLLSIAHFFVPAVGYCNLSHPLRSFLSRLQIGMDFFVCY